MFTRRNTLKEIMADPGIRPYADKIMVGLDLSRQRIFHMGIPEYKRDFPRSPAKVLCGPERIESAVRIMVLYGKTT